MMMSTPRIPVALCLAHPSAQGGHQSAAFVDLFNDITGGRAQGIRHHHYPLPLQRLLYHRSTSGTGPAHQPNIVLLRPGGHTVLGQDLFGEVPVCRRHHGLQLSFQLRRVGLFSTLIFLGDDHIHGIRLIADASINPVQLLPETLQGKADGAEHTEAPRLADFHHHIAAVGKSKDWVFNAEFFAKGGRHNGLSIRFCHNNLFPPLPAARDGPAATLSDKC